ncbi:MAG: lysophospholipase [Nonomuraea muscovyensis]|nr:lysophospholipase [Nonomuraea muscovyensis]
MSCRDRCSANGSRWLPTHWVHGADDRLMPASGSRAGVEAIRGDDFTERIYPEARHEVFNETNKEEVLADVTAFVHRALNR